jgi:hypothetical protein
MNTITHLCSNLVLCDCFTQQNSFSIFFHSFSFAIEDPNWLLFWSRADSSLSENDVRGDGCCHVPVKPAMHHVKNKTCHVSTVKLVFGFDDPSLISKVRWDDLISCLVEKDEIILKFVFSLRALDIGLSVSDMWVHQTASLRVPLDGRVSGKNQYKRFETGLQGRESERNYFTFPLWNSKQRLLGFTCVRCATRCMAPLFWWKLQQLPLAPLSILFTHCWVDWHLAADRRRHSCDQKFISSRLAKSVFCSWL